MIIVTIQQILDMNKQLKDKKIPFDIHVSDGCGSQSFRIEKKTDQLTDADYMDFYEFLETYISTEFKGSSVKIEKSRDRNHFWFRQ